MYKKTAKTVISLMLCLCLMAGGFTGLSFASGETAQPDAAHSHPICGSRCSCPSDSHSSRTWTAWDGTTKMYNGYYYLTEDIVLSATMILNYSYTSYLCLNGHSITCEDTVFDIYSLRSLLISDCVGTGKIETTGSSPTIKNNKYLSIWGGTILNSCEDYSKTIDAYSGTTTYVCGGRVESTHWNAIYAYPGSKVYIQGGTVAGGGTYGCALTGQSDSSDKQSTVTVSGGSIYGGDENYTDALDIQNGSFTMSGGHVYGDVYVPDSRGATTVSGGTIDGWLNTDSGTVSVTGGNLAISSLGNTAVSAGTFHDCGDYWSSNSFGGESTTISGGDFSSCGVVNLDGETWICGGYFDTVRVNDAQLYLSGVPEINQLQIKNPNSVSAQNIDKSGSFGGETVEISLDHPYSQTEWKDGDVLVKNVRSSAVAQRFTLLSEDSRWMYMEYSGTNLVLRILPHGDCGASGDNLKWTLSKDGTLTIYGSGAMKNFDWSSNQPWNYNKTKIYVSKVVLESGVTSIGSSAFAYLDKITALNIPEGVTRIESWCMEGLEKLESLSLPSTVSYIGNIFASWSLPAALKTISYNGCSHQWANVEVASNNPHFTPVFIENTNKDDGNCLTALYCSVCGGVDVPAREAHSGGQASCTEAAKCEFCGTSYGEFGHDHAYFWEDETLVYACSVCGDGRTVFLSAEYNTTSERLLVDGALPQGLSIFAASYDGDGRMLSAVPVAEAGELPFPGASSVRLFVLNESHLPVSEPVTLS